jgi:hypothetical protein
MKKCSLHISLVLVGTLAVGGCGGDSKRQIYKTKQDCLDDWGNEKQCEEIPQSSPHYRTGGFFGPRLSGRTAGHLGSGRSIGSVSVPRGGFGHSAGLHSSGG